MGCRCSEAKRQYKTGQLSKEDLEEITMQHRPKRLRQLANFITGIGEVICSISFMVFAMFFLTIALLLLGLLAIFYQEVLGDLLSSLKFW